MLLNIDDQVIHTLFPVLILLIIFLVVVFGISYINILIPMQKRINELSRITYTLLNKEKLRDDDLDSIKKGILTVNENVESLSTSTKQVLIEFRDVHDTRIMPTPQLSEMIRQTINEQITIETILSRNMKIPVKNSTKYIIENVVKTYPHIDQTYLTKLSMAMIEDFVRSKDK